MRRASALLIIPLLAAAAVAGCSSSSSSSSTGSSSRTAGTSSSSAAGSPTANASVAVTGAFGASPQVTIPKELAGSNLVTKTLVQGSGQTVVATDSVVSDFVVYNWTGSTAKLLSSTFTKGNAPTILTGSTALEGIKAAIVGQKIGSRVLAVVPPKEGFGTSGNSQVGIKGTDTLVFVIDMIQSFAGTAAASGQSTFSGGTTLPSVTAVPGKPATITIPSAAAPKSLMIKTLVKGSGTTIAANSLALVQYTGVVWKAGTPKPFDSSLSHSPVAPYSIVEGQSQVIQGWTNGLKGQAAGSRLMLIIPPAQGYGTQAQNGIPANSTLVFVIDVLGVYPAR